MLIERIDQWTLDCPDRVAHQYRDNALTYSELERNSDGLAVWIHNELEGMTTSPVLVFGHKENEMLVAFLACAKAGHAYIPVDSSTPLERVRQIIEASGAALILSPQTIPEGLKLHKLRILDNIRFNNEAFLRAFTGQTPNRDWRVREEDVFYIIFTSGSTGTPKGVQITLNALESFLNWVNPAYEPEKMREVFLNQAPFSFDLSVMDLYMSLSTGGTLWSIDKEEIANPRELFQSFARSGISIWVSTPSFAELCLMDKGFNQALLPELKRFLFCGEVLAHDTAAKLLERFPGALVENLYGPTEGTVAITTVTITPEVLDHYNPLPVGRVKPDAQILICNSTSLDSMLNSENPNLLDSPPRSLPEGERGEIVIAGPNVSVGYLNRPEQNRRAFFAWRDVSGKEWRAYRTGDAGVMEDGLLFFFGRLDFQVKLHGYRIELGDIEENLRKAPGVQNAVVLPVERRGKVDHLQAFLTTAETVSDEFQASQKLREALQKSLPDYMIPRRFTFLETMPMTSNGKVDRRALGGRTL